MLVEVVGFWISFEGTAKDLLVDFIDKVGKIGCC